MTVHINNNDGQGNSSAPSADSLAMPTTVALDSKGGLYVTDRENRRVLYFADVASDDTTADQVYGQFGNFRNNMVNNDGTGAYGEPSADNISVFTLGLATDSQGGFYVSDAASHRVLYFADDGNTTADRVYGQFDNFSTDARNNDGAGRLGTPSASSLNFPRGLLVDSNNGLYVADRDNNRVLYFAADGNTVADRIYGQFGSFTTNAENNDGSGNKGTPSADSLSHPKSIALDAQGGLYISDTMNHRVLYFAPDGDTTADWVFGQYGSLTTGVINNEGTGATGSPNEQNLNGPQGIVLSSDRKLYIADTDNNRILVVPLP
ncbi:MAG TPA: NHL repeat-containing protein [Phototrophicaceae bacterium]|jgi:sugar lactone lactonase YvrE|nr:NHL repeat-containing protein [Phototrophicaceae bacterium]